MYSDDDIQYALQMTQVLREPTRNIDTFGNTSFEFHLISELLDKVGAVRVRKGKIEAHRPTIIKPEEFSELMFEGFGEQADQFADWLKRNSQSLAFLKYGFNFCKSNVTESVVHDPFEDVKARVLAEADSSANPLNAVIQGVDDTWEICLLKFTVEVIQKSQNVNVFDFQRRGLL
jgi:hypothetical protein